MQQVWPFIRDNYRDGIEILILAVLIYQAYRYFRATRAARILTGLLALALVLFALSYSLKLQVIPWILSKLTLFLSVALVVLFQPELRRALADLGGQRLFFNLGGQDDDFVDRLSEAVLKLANNRFGALIALEQRIELSKIVESGVELDADISHDLLLTLFHPKTALHDGGVILRQGRIHAAACVFPVSHKESLARSLGLRHRAGLGLSEESDAIVIIVSEETGQVSLAVEGELELDVPRADLPKRLAALLGTTPEDEDDLSGRDGEGADTSDTPRESSIGP